jgi:hypothetical protein
VDFSLGLCIYLFVHGGRIRVNIHTINATSQAVDDNVQADGDDEVSLAKMKQTLSQFKCARRLVSDKELYYKAKRITAFNEPLVGLYLFRMDLHTEGPAAIMKYEATQLIFWKYTLEKILSPLNCDTELQAMGVFQDPEERERPDRAPMIAKVGIHVASHYSWEMLGDCMHLSCIY